MIADAGGGCGSGGIGGSHEGVVQFRLIPCVVQRGEAMIVHNHVACCVWQLPLAGMMLVLTLGQQRINAEGFLGLLLLQGSGRGG